MIQKKLIKKGIPVSPGIAIHEAHILGTETYKIASRTIAPEEVETEVDRFDRALHASRRDVEDLQQHMAQTLGPDVAGIFLFHLAMLGDRQFHADIDSSIREDRQTAEYAVSQAIRKRLRMFADRAKTLSHFAERDRDFYDIENRLLTHLLGERCHDTESLTGERVLLARDLTPSQTATLDTSKIKGFAMEAGGRTSHTAIVARAHAIPAVVGLGPVLAEINPGDMVIVDGTKGILIIRPDEATIKEYNKKRKQYIEYERDLSELRTLPAETTDGHEITLLANVEFPEEIPQALEYGAQGIGLYRSEFLFLEKGGVLPTEDEHFGAYRKAVETLDGRPITIRTLDLGADKSIGLLPQEMNPFLGCRSIRLCFRRRDIFKTQLRAILRASAYGPINLMLPMITSIEEVREAKKFIHDAMEELEREHIPFDSEVPVGIMIEVPSAALCADLLAREVDFFSIGTNDLVQYTLAVDRVNEQVAYLYQPVHPSILRLLIGIIEAGHRHGIKVSMCGEMSGDVHYTVPLIGMGLRNQSVSAATIPEVKKMIRSINVREATRVVERIFRFVDSAQTERYLRNIVKQYRIHPF